MSNRMLGGSMSWDFYDAQMNLVLSANSLTDSGLNATVSKTGVRGGDGHKLLANFFYESGLMGSLTDPLFNLNYLATKFGSDVTMGADIQELETITTTVLNTITVTKTPVAFPGTTLIVGAYKLASSTDDVWTKITFSGSSATVSGLAIGTTVCVKYFATDLGARELIVPTSLIPKILYGVGRANEFKAGTSGSVDTSSSKIGELQVVVPQAQFDPNTDLALTSSGTASTSLDFEALANNTLGCTGEGYYAILSETTIGGNPYSNCVAIGIADGDVDLGIGETEKLQVYGFYNDGTAPSLLDNSTLTFTSGTTATATIGADGTITGVAGGTSTITVVVTSKTSLSTNCVVTVA